MGKTRLQMRNDLATDLKVTIDTELSVAELNRCIEVAVADLSRFLPRERTYEEILNFTVTDESVTMPKDTDADGVVADEDLSAVDDGSACTIDGQPDVPRPLTCTITDADDSITGMTVTVYGTGADGLAVQETFHWLRGGSKTITGKMYFRNVYSAIIDQIDGAGASDLLDIGWGAYTDVWVNLAYKPIKWGSESSVTDGDSNTIVRETDFWIDYINGRIKAVSGGDIAAEDTVTISYTKNQVGIDLSGLADFIRVHRTEYPVGEIPQQFVQTELFGKMLMITGHGEVEEQQALQDKKQVRVQYDAYHVPPNDFAPGTVPEFLENTVLKAAASYALLILALKNEHQAVTDLGTARTATAAADTEQTNLDTALTNIKKYLDNNSDNDAAGLLKDIVDDAGDLWTKIKTALDAMNTYLDAVATDISNADDVRTNYLTTTNYVDGGTEPDIKTYLESGDALINNITEGGEDERTPEVYAIYARAVRDALVGAWEHDREQYLRDGTIRINAALGYAQEVAQRVSSLRTFIEQSTGYQQIALIFAREAENRIAKINSLLAQASRSIEAAGGDLVLADRFRTESIERRDEVWTIWRDRKEYIGDFAASSMSQTSRE